MCVIVRAFSVYHGEQQADSNRKGPETKTGWLLETLHFYAQSQEELGVGSHCVEGIWGTFKTLTLIGEL